ncbi:MAG: glycosyltransferase family 4 protein [Alphaproteobacteria bacterium]|nr:glycosyltransferase family 4 protein [Alphaproteobacteria bacterium]
MLKSLEGKTILQIVPSLDVGGPERSTLDVAAAIVRAGGRAFVISAGGRMVDELEKSGATHFSWEAGSKDPRIIWKNHSLLKDFVRMERVNLVHVRSRAPAWSAYLATRQSNVPMVTTMHSSYDTPFPWEKFYNSIMTKGERTITLSRAMASYVEKNYNVPPERITVIPRGIDLNTYNRDNVSEERKEKLAQQILLPEGVPFILFPGRLMKAKGQEIALQALAKIQEPFFCLIVGPDHEHVGYREHLKAMKQKLFLQDKVTFLDHVDLPAAYMHANVVLCPSQIPEAFGRVAAEAQAMGMPVIASNLGAMSETILDGQTGWLVEPGNVDELADAIRNALQLSHSNRLAMAEKAIMHARANFNMERMCATTLAVYAELLK